MLNPSCKFPPENVHDNSESGENDNKDADENDWDDEDLAGRWVETDTISNTACWIEFPTAVNKNVICISGAHGKSTCNVSSLWSGVLSQIGVYDKSFFDIDNFAHNSFKPSIILESHIDIDNFANNQRNTNISTLDWFVR